VIYLIKIQEDFNHGNNKLVDFAVDYVIIFLGMVTTCRNIGES